LRIFRVQQKLLPNRANFNVAFASTLLMAKDLAEAANDLCRKAPHRSSQSTQQPPLGKANPFRATWRRQDLEIKFSKAQISFLPFLEKTVLKNRDNILGASMKVKS